MKTQKHWSIKRDCEDIRLTDHFYIHGSWKKETALARNFSCE